MSAEKPEPSDTNRVQRPNYWQRIRRSKDGSHEERVIYSALPAIVLANDFLQSEHGAVITVDREKDLTVHADTVCILGKLELPGRNVRIVARKLILRSGKDKVGKVQSAEINTDGKPGATPINTDALDRPEKLPDRAKDADPFSRPSVISGAPGAAGGSDPKNAARDGEQGQSGSDAGNIEIYVDSLEGEGIFSACGGNGHAGQNGQPGQDGQDGGRGFELNVPGMVPVGYPGAIAPPGAGGRGGDAGRGGAGGSGGEAGKVVINSVKPRDPKSIEIRTDPDSVEPRKPGAILLRANPGKKAPDGLNGDPGVGGWSGDPRRFGPAAPRLPVAMKIVGAKGPVMSGATVALQTFDKQVGAQNTLGYFWDKTECYYWDYADHEHQDWVIALVTDRADKVLRYGDQVTFRLKSTGHFLAPTDVWLHISGQPAAWTLRPGPGHHHDGDQINTADAEAAEPQAISSLYLEGEMGRQISAAPSEYRYWYPYLAKPSITRAPSGTVRSSNALTPVGPKTAIPPSYNTISVAQLSEAWSPTQAALQVERLNALLLTSEFSGVQNDDLYEEIAAWLGIFSASRDEKLLSARGRIIRIAGNLDRKLDVFGRQRDYAPNLSWTYYDRELTQALDDFAKFEEHHAALLSAVEVDDAKQRDAAAKFNVASARVAVAEQALEEALKKFKAASTTLNQATAVMSALKEPLRPGEADGPVSLFVQEVQKTFNCFDFNQLLEALSMMAFCPPVGEKNKLSGGGVLMAAGQAASYLEHGLNTIQTASGESIKKSKVLEDVKSLQGDLFQSAQKIWTDSKGFKEDSFLNGILATLDQWQKLVDQFTSLESAKQLAKDIHALFDAVLARGTALMDYNIALGDVYDLMTRVSDNNRVIAESLKAVEQGNAPELDDQLTFLSRQYEEQKNSIIELVYMANRAFAYWRLDDLSGSHSQGTRNVFHNCMTLDKRGVYAAIDATVLSSCHKELKTWFHNDLSRTDGKAEAWPTAPGISDGLQVWLPEPAVKDFVQLRPLFGHGQDVHYVTINIADHTDGLCISNEHLAGLWNFRLTGFRVFLVGAHREPTLTTDSLIHIEFLRHSKEYNYTYDGLQRAYSRPELQFRSFVYDGSRNAHRYERGTKRFNGGFIVTDGKIGSGALDLDESGGSPLYAGVSPFGAWTIVLDPRDHLDSDKHTNITFDDDLRIEIQLLGTARTRNPNTRTPDAN